MPQAREIHDFVILLVPSGADPDDPMMMARMADMAHNKVMAQYADFARRPSAIVMDEIDWLVTNDPEMVLAHQPGDGCPTCIAGNDQAVAFLREFPERVLACGNLHYWEMWP